MSYTSNTSHLHSKKLESSAICSLSHVSPNEMSQPKSESLECTATFIPGNLKEDSPRDRLFYHLFQSGKINAYGECISSETWERPTPLVEDGFREIRQYLTRNIQITCQDTFKTIYSTTITLLSLLEHINQLSSSDIFFFGSHLQEIASRCRFGLNNLKKIVSDDSLLGFLKKSVPIKSGDSDWRVFPKKNFTSEDILNLTQDVINFIGNNIYNSLTPENIPHVKLYELCKYVKNTALLKFFYFDSTQNREELKKEKKTVYSTISFGDKDNQPVDLMFIKEIENPCLFNLDDLKMNIHHFLNPNKVEKKVHLESSTSDNTWQQIIDHSLYILHCPTLVTCDEMGWLRALRHMTKGGRFFQEGIDLTLFKKINPEKLPDMIYKYFKKIESTDRTGIKALYFHILIFLKQNFVDEKIIEDIQKRIEIEFLQLSELNNLFEYLNLGLKEPSLPFDLVYSLLHFMLFLNMGANAEKVTISRNGVKPVFEVSDVYFLQTSGSLKTAINTLGTFQSLSEKALEILEKISNYLMPRKEYASTVNEALKSRLHYFDIDFEQLPQIALQLLKQSNPLIQKYGYNLLLLSFLDSKVQNDSYLWLIHYYPHIIQNEDNIAEKIRITTSVYNLLKNTTLNSLKNVFGETHHANTFKYFSCFVLHMDYSSSSFVIDLWHHMEMTIAEKKAGGIELLQKIASYEIKMAMNLFQSLLINFGLNQNEIIFIFKKMCLSNENKISSQNVLIFNQAAMLVILNQDPPYDALKEIENEFILIIKKLTLYGLKQEAKALLKLGMDRSIISVHTAASIGIFKEFLSPSLLFQDNLIFLRQAITGGNLQNALCHLNEALTLEKTNDESSILRECIHDLFHRFSKESNFPETYPLLFTDAFQELFSSYFDDKCFLYCLYLKTRENENFETFKILSLLLSDLKNASDFNCSIASSFQLVQLIVHSLQNFHVEVHLSFKNLLIEKTPLILNLLTSYEQHELLILLLTAMQDRKFKMKFDKVSIENIINSTKKELLNNRFIESIYQLFLSLKLYHSNPNPQAIILETHNLLMEKLLNSNLEKLAKNMLGSLLKSEEPNVQSLTVWANIFSPKKKCFDTYMFLIQNLLSYIETSQNTDSLYHTLTLFLESDPCSFSNEFRENLYFNFKISLISVNRFISCKTRAEILRGLNIFQNCLSDELLEIDSDHKVLEDIEKTMLQMIVNLSKLTVDEKRELPEKFGLIYLEILSKYPRLFKLLNHSCLIKSMLNSPDCYMHITSGKVLHFLILPLKIQAETHLIASSLKYFQKMLSLPENFKQEKHYHELAKKDLLNFLNLKTFNLHFSISTKAEIIGKLIYFRLTELKDLSNDELQEEVLTNFIYSIPILIHHPEVELLCMEQALNILISSLVNGNKKFFIHHYLNLLNSISENAESYQFKSPYRLSNNFTLIINKLLEVEDINEDYSLIILTSIQQNIFILLKDLATCQMELKSNYLDSLALICKKKRQGIIEVIEKLLFFPPGQTALCFNDHLEQLTKITLEAKELNLFQDKPKLKNLIDLYIHLNPKCLLESPGQIRNQSLVNETLSMIDRLLKFNSPILMLRVICILSSAQKITIAYKDQKKRRDFLEPENYLICFKKIQESILLNPFFKSLVYEADEPDEAMDKPSEKENYFFYQIQFTLFENPHFLNINRSKEWGNVFLEISTLWCKTLIQFYLQETSEDLKGLILGSLCEFMDLTNRLYCYSGHFHPYHLILKQFVPLLIQHIDFLNANQDRLERYLKAHDLMNLFHINSSLNKTEHAILAKLATTVLQQIMKIKHPSAKIYLEKQLELGKTIKIFHATDLKKLRELLSKS